MARLRGVGRGLAARLREGTTEEVADRVTLILAGGAG